MAVASRNASRDKKQPLGSGSRLSNWVATQDPYADLAYKDIASIQTSKGSIYNYLADGSVQRYKAAEDSLLHPKSAIVFVPDFETLKKAGFGGTAKARQWDDEEEFNRDILSYILDQRSTVRIVDNRGHELTTNGDIMKADQVTLAFTNRMNKLVFFIPVSKIPRIGYSPFDIVKGDS